MEKAQKKTPTPNQNRGVKLENNKTKQKKKGFC